MIEYRSEAGSRIVEIRVEGHLDKADFDAVSARLVDDLRHNGKDRILEIIEHFAGIEPMAMWADLKLAFHLPTHIDRVAVVADQGWIRSVSHLGGLFTSAEVRAFQPSELAEARRWLETERTGGTG